MNKVSYKVPFFGPFLLQTSVDLKICKELIKRAKKLKTKANKALAGHIEKELRFEDNDANYFSQNISSYFNMYNEIGHQALQTNINKKHLDGRNHNLIKFNLDTLWVNFMKEGEFNPPHTHDGDLSFVLFLDIPKVLQEENEKYVGRSEGPGALSFFYGEANHYFSNCSYSIFPKTGDLFIFPANLQHFVYPFESKCNRISMSGNLNIVR
jgi:hypothetical protein